MTSNVFGREARNSLYEVAFAGVLVLTSSGAPAQNLFQADNSTGNIYEYAPGGARTTFATGLNGPSGLAFDSAGGLFVANYGNSTITKITTGGVKTTFASGLDGPVGLAFNSAGDLFVADFFSGNIYEYTPNGVRSTFATSLLEIAGLAFDSAGDLFVADTSSALIYEFTPDGTRSTFATGMSAPYQIAFDTAGDLFVANYGNGTIAKITPGGAQSTFASGLAGPVGVAVDSAGEVFVANHSANTIVEFTTGWAQSTFASGLSGPTALLFQPVPEPSVFVLLAIGAIALLFRHVPKARPPSGAHLPLPRSASARVTGVKIAGPGGVGDYHFKGSIRETQLEESISGVALDIYLSHWWLRRNKRMKADLPLLASTQGIAAQTAPNINSGTEGSGMMAIAMLLSQTIFVETSGPIETSHCRAHASSPGPASVMSVNRRGLSPFNPLRISEGEPACP